MVSLLFCLVGVKVNQPTNEVVWLERKIKEVSAQTLPLIPREQDAKRRALAVLDVADNLEIIDDSKALQLLDSVLTQNKNSIYRSSAIRQIASINPAKGRKLVDAIDDSEDRMHELRWLPGALAFRHPDIASQEKWDDQVIFETVLDLCRIRIEIGISFLKMLKGVNVLEAVYHIGGNLKRKDAELFWSSFPLPKDQEGSYLWLDRNRDVSGKEIEEAAKLIQDRREQVFMLLEAIKVYRKTDPKRGRDLADSLVDLAKSGKETLRFKIGDDSWEVSWEETIVPEISFADTPKVRRYLDSVAFSENQFVKLGLVEAWSRLDMKKATIIADNLSSDGLRAFTGPHGQSVDDHYLVYLCNLAKIDPAAAAKRLAQFKLVSALSLEHDDGGGVLLIHAIHLIEQLMPDHAEQVRVFCQQKAPWSKAFGPHPEKVPEYLQLSAEIRADPRHSAHLLEQMKGCPSSFFLLNVGLSESYIDVAAALAEDDVDQAIKLVDVFETPDDKCEQLCRTASRGRALTFANRAKLIDAALGYAQRVPDTWSKIRSLTDVADTCKAAWVRLQPWPLGK